MFELLIPIFLVVASVTAYLFVKSVSENDATSSSNDLTREHGC
jgi:hypothetical protein